MKIEHIAPEQKLPKDIRDRIDKLALKAGNAWVKSARQQLTKKLLTTVGKPDWATEQAMARLESAKLPVFQGWLETTTTVKAGGRRATVRVPLRRVEAGAELKPGEYRVTTTAGNAFL